MPTQRRDAELKTRCMEAAKDWESVPLDGRALRGLWLSLSLLLLLSVLGVMALL